MGMIMSTVNEAGLAPVLPARSLLRASAQERCKMRASRKAEWKGMEVRRPGCAAIRDLSRFLPRFSLHGLMQIATEKVDPPQG